MSLVARFYNDEKVRDAVHAYCREKIDEAVLELTYKGEDTKHLKGAKEFIDEIFYQMECDFMKREKKPREDI